MSRTALVGGMAAALVVSAHGGEIDRTLQNILDQAAPGEIISTLVYLQDQVDVNALGAFLDDEQVTLRERHEVVVNELQRAALTTQGDLLDRLADLQAAGAIESYREFWITNAVRVDATVRQITALAARPDVGHVFYNAEIEGVRPVEPADPAALDNSPTPVGGIEPGVVAIRAPEVWDMGITGVGALVASLDTGVDGDHSALAGRWRGLDPAYAGNPEWAWFDPVTLTTFPQAFGSHGTHTMGTVCGGSPGDQVGVAPGAEWIHAAVIDRVSINQTIADAILAFQWMIDPDENPGTNFDVPDVCSNSWGLADVHGVPDCDATFWTFLDACEAAGTVIVFSAGNEGATGLRRPADRATDDYRTFAVGAVDSTNFGFPWPIAGFSSTGPTLCGPGGSQAIKPDISAPGVDVRSAVDGGGYSQLSGTSMASPHVNGVIALMREANPDISVEQIKQIIFDTAVDLGGAGEDNVYGWGMIDALEAVTQALGAVNLTFSFPNGLPDVLDPNGGTTVRVVVTGQAVQPEPDTGFLYYSVNGGPFTQVAMTPVVVPSEYDAVFPAFDCLDEVTFYFSCDADSGDTVFNPFSAPISTYFADVYTGINVDFADDFEADLGWTVVDGPGLVTGTWQRGVPAGGGDRGDPANDADGSGQCYVTHNIDGDFDIDGGQTTLSSPDMDASHPDAVLSYYRWYSNTFGADPMNDIFIVEVSDDGGASWVNLETVGPGGSQVGGGWFLQEWLVADIPGVSNSATFRVRFTAGDLNDPSVVEAGVDGIQISRLFCDTNPCPWDLDGGGDVGTSDLLELLAAWGPNPGHPADFDGDDNVGTSDLLELLANWGGCP